jgi:hypothetical protein
MRRWTRGRARRRTGPAVTATPGRAAPDTWRGAGAGSLSRARASWLFWTARVGVVGVEEEEDQKARAAAWPDLACGGLARAGCCGASLTRAAASIAQATLPQARSQGPGLIPGGPCRRRNELVAAWDWDWGGWREDMQNFKFPFWIG